MEISTALADSLAPEEEKREFCAETYATRQRLADNVHSQATLAPLSVSIAHAVAGHGLRAESKGWLRTVFQKMMAKKRIPVWGLLLGIVLVVGVVSGFFSWWYWGKGDLGPKRWAQRATLFASQEFENFVQPHEIDGRMSRDWAKPNVAVYSVPAIPPSRPTLRELTDNG